MAIQHRRGKKATMPILQTAQFGVTTDTKEVYVGNGGSTNMKILDEKDKAVIDTALATRKTEIQSLTSSKADRTYVEQLTQSLASGSPKGTYATKAALDTAFPTGNTNIYVVTADGKWYYWNGTIWTPGGVYQSSGVTNGSIKAIHTDFLNSVAITPTLTDGYYYRFDGLLVPQASFTVSNSIELNYGETIEVGSRGATTSVAIISRWTESGEYIETVATSIDSTFRTYKYTATKEKEFIRISGMISPAMTCTKYIDIPTTKNVLYTEIKNIKTELDELSNVDPQEPIITDYHYLLNNVLHIGDSLTRGAYYGGGNVRDISENYPFYMRRIANCTNVNASISGITPSLWYTSESGKYDYTKFDTVIIWLGTNGGLTDTLLADTTITGSQTYENYANTPTGNYCKIIEKIKKTNPNVNIFLVNVFVSSGVNFTITNNVIKQIATKYSLPVIDIKSNEELTNTSNHLIHPQYNGTNNIHFGKVGNLKIANFILKNINKFISENLNLYNKPID